ncbi:paramyosin-like isoform X2 [Lineus longissimus]|uniref:paramyosin-like isoform X2 n=1 Tax=Lineus longissimus TaxID=88925 RepID=UPI002B4CCEFE
MFNSPRQLQSMANMHRDEILKKMSNCDELHALAESSRERIKQIQDQYLKRADEINMMLLEKHKAELMRVVQEKMEDEKKWSEEKQDLKDEIARLLVANKRMEVQVENFAENEGKAQIYSLKLDAVTEENENLLAENEKYKVVSENLLIELRRLQQIEADNERFMQDIKDLAQKNKEMQFKIGRMEREVDEAGDAQESANMVDILKHKLAKLQKEKRALSNVGAQNGHSLDGLKDQIEELVKRIRQLEMEKARMLEEIELLKHELLAHKRSPTSSSVDRDQKTFKEFVQLKRELTTLREENESLKLKLRAKASATLPMLVDRVSPAISVGSSKDRKKSLPSIKQS